jgi:hypothetical protein
MVRMMLIAGAMIAGMAGTAFAAEPAPAQPAPTPAPEVQVEIEVQKTWTYAIVEDNKGDRDIVLQWI